MLAWKPSRRFLAAAFSLVTLYSLFWELRWRTPYKEQMIELTKEFRKHEPEGQLSRVEIDGVTHSARPNATLLALVRNEELPGMLNSMRTLERTWNSKFNYPWTFFSDVPFSDAFKRATQAATKANCSYGMQLVQVGFPMLMPAETIPPEHWEIPEWINQTKFEESKNRLASQKVKYARMTSYRQMCRWNSGFFYKHPALDDMQYYWRVEPDVQFFCDVDYDVFRYMSDNEKTYGFTINIFDNPDSIPTLWEETTTFIADNPEFVAANNSMAWLTDSSRPDHNLRAGGYSTCHFWSNFEIAALKFWRSDAYQQYFNHLDKTGGFFYERWGDAPVHSIALGLFESAKNIHWFRDIGYSHPPFFNCPSSPGCSGCVAGKFTSSWSWMNLEDCRPSWFKFSGLG